MGSEERWNKLLMINANLHKMVRRGEAGSLVNFIFASLVTWEDGKRMPTPESWVAMGNILRSLVQHRRIEEAEAFRRKYDEELFFLDKVLFDHGREQRLILGRTAA